MGALCTVEMDYQVPRCGPRGLDLDQILQWPCAQTASKHVRDGETEHLTTPAHTLSVAVFVGWLLKGGVVKVHYALCSVKRCRSKQKRTAKIGEIKDPAGDAFQISGFGLNGVRKLSVLTCSHSV